MFNVSMDLRHESQANDLHPATCRTMDLQQCDEYMKMRVENDELKKKLESLLLDAPSHAVLEEYKAKLENLQSELKDSRSMQHKAHNDLMNELSPKSGGDGDSLAESLTMIKHLTEKLVSW